jgi:hypothetical protein
MKKAFMVTDSKMITNKKGEVVAVPTKRIQQGFTGFPGYRYHPTKGFRKEAGYKPSKI